MQQPLCDPEMPLSVRDMFEAGVHFGHQTKRWNPKMRPYLYGARNGIHIIDLDQSVQLFKRAFRFVMDTTARGGHVLFVISDHENIVLHRPSAPPLPVSVSVSPIYTDRGEHEGVVLILRDLSRVRELEDTVKQADRLSMLGTLAAGLAHEIKNPLGGIKVRPSCWPWSLAPRARSKNTRSS
jgi:nitrogen-specific signal transduction histidine kinase